MANILTPAAQAYQDFLVTVTAERNVRFVITVSKDDNGNISSVHANRDFATKDEAAAHCATFPKYVGVKPGTCRGLLDDAYTVWGTANFYVQIAADGVNKGINESGVKRLRKFLALADYVYMPLYGNSLTAEEFAAFVASVK